MRRRDGKGRGPPADRRAPPDSRAAASPATAAPLSGGQLNPAVTLGSAVAGGTPWSKVPWRVLAQFLGPPIGAVLPGLVFTAAF